MSERVLTGQVRKRAHGHFPKEDRTQSCVRGLSREPMNEWKAGLGRGPVGIPDL